MEIFLVGGAVRNQLLHLPVNEYDWVVVGSTAEQMLAQGYQAVGKDFPVFLHPKSREEYALARTERKVGHGYTGFSCIADPSVSLEEDLLRRDLTINAIAQHANGQLIDPFNGQADIKNKVLRHISPAFAEDPLRVLRVARFAALFAHLGFVIAEETLQLMQSITQAGELEHLVAERIWKETEKALLSASPHIYFQVLRDCGALQVLFPEVDALFGVPQSAEYHPEIDSGIHTLMVLEQAAKLSDDINVRFAALTHDLGKALTPKTQWPKHINHEKRGLAPLKALCKRVKVPNKAAQLAAKVCEFHLLPHRAFELRPNTVYKLFSSLDAWRNAENVEQFLLCCEADSRGRTGFEHIAYPQADYFRALLNAAQKVSINDIAHENLTGKQIGAAIEHARIDAIAEKKRELI